MRKFILLGLMAAVALPAAAQSQSRGEIRRDREEVREQRDDLRDARQRGDRRDARQEREELREARQELREDRRDRRRSQYVAPYRNWHYNAVRTGHRLRPAFYGSRYHIANPAQYRLRPAARNQRWIRYGNDLLLVNTRTGRVLQVAVNRY
ncbi:RcnB family protein [Sphingosinicella sp. CPCC 101087]|uniref:RcnB family protein n=1 Tax=Sphingosinicella sp. CPCC 101087 TaxID=2497754 RepID=UPI00101CA59F|nr:RcnB family protein [Sphingosinicella sp. CPCC 101087]